MNKLTKFSRIILAIAMMLTVGFSSFAHHFEVDGIYYNYLDETFKTVEVTINGSSSKYTGVVIIPSSVTYNDSTYTVISIGDDAFFGCTGLTSVTIPNSVTSVGNSAFSGCNGLTEVNISDISAWCNIDFANYDSNPLYYAKKLKLNGTEIKDLVIPNDISQIKAYTFYSCSGLKSATIGNSVTSIGDRAFYNCTGLTSATIPNSVTSVGNSAFSGCSGLTEVTIGNSVTSIGSSAFNSCRGLTSVTIGNSVTSIGSGAFKNCWRLTSVTIPNSVTEIGPSAFLSCSGLTKLVLEDGDNTITGLDFADSPIDSLYLGRNTSAFLRGKESLKSVTIGDCVTSISNLAFENCTGLTSVTIPNSVTEIGSSAFLGCIGVTKLVLEDGDNTITGLDFADSPIDSLYLGRNTSAFLRGKKSLKSVTIGDCVTSISDYTFRNCTGLTSITIPNSVITIGSSVFYNCTGLTEVNYNAENCTSMGSSSYPVFSGCSNLKTLNIGNEVKNIPPYAFYNCDGLASVTIPNSVTSIGYYAFYSCDGLTSVTIGNSVTLIGSGAFSSCTSLTEVTIPNSVSSIGASAFSSCTSLTEVTIPNSVSSIGASAFSSCTSLTEVTIPNSVSSIGASAFSSCWGLNEVNISDLLAWCKVDFSNFDSNPLGYAKKLILNSAEIKDLVIPNDITEIKNYAFYNCEGLISVTIPNSVTSIGNNAFYSCENLKYVLNLSDLIITKGSSDNGYIAYYADEVEKLSDGWIEDDFVWIESEDGNRLFRYLGNATELILPTDYKGENYEIGDSAFANYKILKQVTIPNFVTSIGASAFSGCTALTEVNFNAENCTSMSTADAPVFKDCLNLKTINIGNSVKSIPSYAFYGCSGLVELTIPSTDTWIGDKVFWGCNKLIESEVIDRSQTTVSIAVSSPTKYQTGITTDKNENILSESNNVLIKGLKPNTRYTYNSSLKINDTFCEINSFAFTTKDMIFKNSDVVGATSFSSKAYYEGDVTVLEYGINWGNENVVYNNVDSISVCNLNPNTTYKVYYFLNTQEGGEYSTTWNITTKSLTWNTGEFTATSTSSARISVETNCVATDGTGFEWKRYDAPESLAPSKAPCPIVDGKLIGSLRGLNPDVYYNCRPYYTSSSGKTYYGKWFTIFTGDANVYFEPEVSTSDKNTVVDNSAVINGYALAGSDDILEQGFEYWKSSTSPATYSTSGVMVAKASGISMSATITNLEYSSTYRYRAYVKTSKGSFYGSEKELVIGEDPAGVGYIESDVIDAEEVARYDIHGRRLNKPTKGINIIKMSNGTTRKEIVK